MITEERDAVSRNNKNPLQIKPSNQTNYIGKIQSIDLDSNNGHWNHAVKFNILGLPEFQDEWPVAIPLGAVVRELKVGQLIKIWDVCDTMVGTHTFFYEPIFSDDFVGMQNREHMIDLTEEDKVTVKYPNFTLTAKKDNQGDEVIIDLTAKMTVDGNQDVEVNGGIVTINSGSSKVEIKSGEINITAGATGTINIDGSGQLNLKGAQITVPATAIMGQPAAAGFCGLPNCVMSGAPQAYSSIMVVPTP